MIALNPPPNHFPLDDNGGSIHLNHNLEGMTPQLNGKTWGTLLKREYSLSFYL